MIELVVDGKKAYTHISLVRPKNQPAILENQVLGGRYSALFGWKLSSMIPLFHGNLYAKFGFSAFIGLLGYFGSSKLLKGILDAKNLEHMIEGDTPYWFDKHRTPNFDRIFYELPDDGNYEPSLLFSGISERQLKGFFPDGVLTRGLRFDHEQAQDTHHGHH